MDGFPVVKDSLSALFFKKPGPPYRPRYQSKLPVSLGELIYCGSSTGLKE